MIKKDRSWAALSFKHKQNKMITIDQFHETEIVIGKIISAEKVPDTDKLLKLSVDIGVKILEQVESGESENRTVIQERDIRQIISGISAFFPEPTVLAGKHVAFVTNLEPRMLRGLESQGMILAAHSGDSFALIEVPETIPPGTRIG